MAEEKEEKSCFRNLSQLLALDANPPKLPMVEVFENREYLVVPDFKDGDSRDYHLPDDPKQFLSLLYHLCGKGFITKETIMFAIERVFKHKGWELLF